MKKIVLALLISAAFPFAACAQVVDGVDSNGFGMDLVYPAVHISASHTAQKAVNRDIAGYVRQMREIYESDKKREVYMNYEVPFEDDARLSIVLETFCMEYMDANGVACAYGLVWDKRNGRRIPLSEYMKIPSVKELIAHIENGDWKLCKPDGTSVTYDADFIPGEVRDSYCLNGDGTISLIFEQGTIAPYSEGELRVKILKKNRTVAKKAKVFTNRLQAGFLGKLKNAVRYAYSVDIPDAE